MSSSMGRRFFVVGLVNVVTGLVLVASGRADTLCSRSPKPARAAGAQPVAHERKNPMAVYTIYNDTGEEYIAGFKFLDGDMKQVLPVGFEFHPVTGGARLADGTRVKKKEFYQGVRVDPTHLPTKVMWKGKKRQLTDIQQAHDIFLVSDSLRHVVEELEPGTHLFAPVELVWEDGSHAASFFWFYPCVRIDGMDREHTTHELDEKAGLWVFKPGKKYVIGLKQVAGHHVWIDPRLTSGSVFVSGVVKQAMADAGVRGIGYNEFPTV